MSALAQESTAPQAYRLSTFLNGVRSVLLTHFSQYFWITAEVSSVRPSRYGYFLELTEVEGGKTLAKAQALLWSNVARRVLPTFEQTTGEELKAGMQLMLQVKVEFTSSYGFSLVINDINAEYTIGAFERLKRETLARLEREGVKEMNKLLPLPRLCLRIAVISSSQAAGWEDFIKQLAQSDVCSLFRLDLYEASMQGQSTTQTILRALDRILAAPVAYDAVAILRGGGSRHDLSAFDEYNLCSALAQYPIPVLTGIGHERDESVADLVAHTRLKTPTALAEFLIRRVQAEIDQIKDVQKRVLILLEDLSGRLSEPVNHLSHHLLRLLSAKQIEERELLSRHSQHISLLLQRAIVYRQRDTEQMQARLHDRLHEQLRQGIGELETVSRRLSVQLRPLSLRSQELFDTLSHRLSIRLCDLLSQHGQLLDSLSRLARTLDPRRIMERGFLPVTQGGSQVSSIHDIEVSSPLTILFTDGKVDVNVNHIDKQE